MEVIYKNGKKLLQKIDLGEETEKWKQFWPRFN